MKNQKTLQTPNSRLITQSFKFQTPTKRWSEILLQALDQALALENLILLETRFQLANPFFTFYFFAHPKDAHFFETSYWVAKEVIGPPQYDLDDRYQIEDLESGQLESVTVFDYFKFNQAAPDDEGERKLAEAILQIPAGTKNWRLELDCEVMPYELRVQFGASCLQT